MRNNLLFIFIWLVPFSFLKAQGVYAPGSREYTRLLQRYEILNGKNYNDVFTSFKPYTRKNIIEALEDDSVFTSKSDFFNKQYLLNDSHEWTEIEEESEKPFLNHFYKKKANAFYYNEKDVFEIHADPILHLNGGFESSNTSSSDFIFSDSSDISESRNFYTNTRGVVVRGMIDKKIGFYSALTENQMRVPGYVEQRIVEDSVVPGEGFWKPFGSKGYDFFNARGYVTFNASKHVFLQFGNDRNFIGNGHRSLILSDFSAPYLFLKVETQIWKLKYTNIFAQLTADYQRSGRLFPRKYMAFHHLSMNIGKKLNIGIFENVIYGRPDDNSLDLAYLNPIIFYRAIEQNVGSPDNATVGLDWRWMPVKKVALYGQLIFDELIVSNLRAGNGWWGNKFGIQGGVKYMNAFGIDNLDLQYEVNAVRPYTYAHVSDFTNYQHYQQPLAHPLGANFIESIGIIRYQPIPRLNIVSKSIFYNRGRDNIVDGEVFRNYGQNIRLDYSSRIQDFGNTLGQGFEQNVFISNLSMSYMLRHNFFIDFNYTLRTNDYQPNNLQIPNNVDPNLNPSGTITTTSHIFQLGLRWNTDLRNFDF
ncbi:hypothetical protein HZR84_10110 [Hyphobacterium sp. CCMP332]|nr:hypothetical protein HZR84_10110 [Hyphobacterium sp. CCMP332]